MKRILVLMMVLGLIFGSIATADAKKKRKTIDVQTHYTEPGFSAYGAQCWGVPLQPECVAHVYGHATFTGTMWGDEYYDQYGSATPDGKINYEGPGTITGGVKGCGTGTYIIDMYEGYVDMTRFDPLTNSAPGYNKWRLRRGSGTGELINLVSGQGENHWTKYWVGKDGDPTIAGEGDFTGTITCRR